MGKPSGSSSRWAPMRNQGVTPKCSGWNHGGGHVGALCSLIRHVDPHRMPSDVCVAMYIDGSKWKDGDSLCGTDMPLDIVQREFLRHNRVRVAEGAAPSAASLFPLAPLWGSWSNPDIITLKWACLQVMVALASSPFVIIPIALSIIVDPTKTRTFSEQVVVGMTSSKISSLQPFIPGICRLTSAYSSTG